MVSTRSSDTTKSSPTAGEKRPAPKAGGTPKKRVKKADKQENKEDDGEDAGAKADAEDDKEVKGDETKENATEKSDKKPDGMAEELRDEEPEGDEVKGNAGPGELAPGTKELEGDEAERKHGIIEKGHIYALYRPKVENDDPHSIDDIARFHFLLAPDSHKGRHRLIAVGKKHMPDASAGTRPLWGEVLEVGEDLTSLKKSLGPSTYETKTMGTRHQPGARVAASGAYVLHSPDPGSYPKDSSNAGAVYHTYLAYKIAVPHELGEVQEALHISAEGAFTIQVKNPDSESTNPVVGNQPASKHPQFPPALKHLFTTKFIPACPPSLLDYAGAELLFIPSKHSPSQDIGQEGKKKLDEEEKELEKDIEGQKGESEVDKALKEVGLEGLIEGKALEGHWE
ncbi:hypothetical protein JCM10207_004287 [Rhodosporidiobolus poonsookiae]